MCFWAIFKTHVKEGRKSEKMKKRIKFTTCLILSLALLFGLMPTVASAKEDIKLSDVEYEVNINNAKRVFIGNDKAVSYEVGKKYFLMYTVSEIESNGTTQSGMIVTTDKEEVFPYTKGGMKYDKKSLLLDEGYTYFFRFEITESGLECIAAKAKGDESEYIKLPHITRDFTTPGQYFGAWMAEGGEVSGKLTHVRCYDEDGNDMGVYGNDTQGVIVLKEGEMKANSAVDHTYSFSLTEAGNIAISNERGTDSKIVYMEYTVKNVKKGKITQSGAIFTNSPTAVFPYAGGTGFMKYTPHKQPGECMLLDEGGTYLIRFEKQADGFDVLIKRTVNGKITYFSYPHTYGEFKADNKYFSIWIGEGESDVSADFVNVKAYDSKGRNLAIQTNQGVEITHYGDLEDYSQCEAVYYCRENDTFIALDDERNAIRRVDNEQMSVTGTYSIREAVLTLNVSGKEETFDYVYKSLTDKDGNTYIRLNDSKVTFVSNSVDGEVLETVKVTAENGYKLAEPSKPSREGRTFQYWQLGNGEQYDFDEVVTKSMTLYAVWDGEDTYTATELLKAAFSAQPVIAIGTSSLLVLATILIVLKIKRGGRHE